MKSTKTRHQFYLPDALSRKLDALADKPGASKTNILSDALSAWLERGASNELDQRFGPRLDRMSGAADRTERKLDGLIELFGVFMQYQMTLVAHQPAFDDVTAKRGRERYNQLVELAERRIGSGGVAARLGSGQSGEGG